MEEIKQMLLGIKNDIKEMKESIDKNNEEAKILREEIKLIQEMEKEKLRKKLVVTGITVPNSTNGIQRIVEAMLKEELGLVANIEEA